MKRSKCTKWVRQCVPFPSLRTDGEHFRLEGWHGRSSRIRPLINSEHRDAAEQALSGNPKSDSHSIYQMPGEDRFLRRKREMRTRGTPRTWYVGRARRMRRRRTRRKNTSSPYICTCTRQCGSSDWTWISLQVGHCPLLGIDSEETNPRNWVGCSNSHKLWLASYFLLLSSFFHLFFLLSFPVPFRMDRCPFIFTR